MSLAACRPAGASGHTFTASEQTWGPTGFNVTDLAVNPFVEGDVWLADANNLWHSVDSGLTWTKLTAMATVGAEYTNVHGAIQVALGAPAPGSSHSAALYLVGTINGKDGVYRSVDMGATWARIDDDAHRYGGVSRIVADTSVDPGNMSRRSNFCASAKPPTTSAMRV